MPTQDFEFHINGLENAILNLLKTGNDDLNISPMTGTQEFSAYSGELDRENVIDALRRSTNRFPLVMVAYGAGVDKRKAATGLLENEPIEIEHTCGFIVVVASNDFRGEKARRSSIYKMIAEVRQNLGGVQFEIEVENEKLFLNHAPLIPSAVECISRMPDLTAYAVHFETMFHEWLPDRREVQANIEEIILDVFIENENLPEFNLPGVKGE